jgi:hypothetical protein
MSFESWYQNTETAKRKQLAEERKKLKAKQDWERVSAQAKRQKQLNRKSKRDIEREVRIANMGGTPIEVQYGKPLTDFIRVKRSEVEWDLKYPKRKEKKVANKEALKALSKHNRTGSRRTEKDFLKNNLKTVRTRAEANNLPFDLELKDFKILDVCPVLGIKLEWGDKITGNTPSFDRVVPELGYIKGNVRIISMRANRLKNNATIEEMEKILEYMKGHR